MKQRLTTWSLWLGLGAFLLLFAALAAIGDRYEPIDRALVTTNQAFLTACDATCLKGGYIRLRHGGYLHIVRDNNSLYRDDIEISSLMAMTKRHDPESDRFFNRIDSVILMTDRARWGDADTEFLLSRSAY